MKIILLLRRRLSKEEKIMTPIEKQEALLKKILVGLDKSNEKLIEFKKQKKSELVIMKDNKVVSIKPE